MHDELIGWVIGFHEFRVWAFRETQFAQGLVYRGGNIRIYTSAALSLDEDPLLLMGSINRSWDRYSQRGAGFTTGRSPLWSPFCGGYKTSTCRQEIHQAVDAGQAFMIRMGVLTLPLKNHEEDSGGVIIWMLVTGRDDQITFVKRDRVYSLEALIPMENGEVA
jgi:hypothetical protein